MEKKTDYERLDGNPNLNLRGFLIGAIPFSVFPMIISGYLFLTSNGYIDNPFKTQNRNNYYTTQAVRETYSQKPPFYLAENKNHPQYSLNSGINVENTFRPVEKKDKVSNLESRIIESPNTFRPNN